jgi:hypothetical protein
MHMVDNRENYDSEQAGRPTTSEVLISFGFGPVRSSEFFISFDLSDVHSFSSDPPELLILFLSIRQNFQIFGAMTSHATWGTSRWQSFVGVRDFLPNVMPHVTTLPLGKPGVEPKCHDLSPFGSPFLRRLTCRQPPLHVPLPPLV